MISFSTLTDALAAVEATTNFVPGSVELSSQNVQDDGTYQKICTIYRYKQEVSDGAGVFNNYKEREAIVVQIYPTGGGDTPNSVGLTYKATSETVEGYTRVVNIPAGQQAIEYQLSSAAFETPTDADIASSTKPRGCVAMVGSGAASDSNPITSYHHWQIPGNLTLGDLAAEWENLPRFTTFSTNTGFYLDPTDQSTWYRMGGFTLNGGVGVTLCGSNTNPAKMPPGGVFATVDLVPQVPILMSSGTPVLDTNGIPTVDTATGGTLYSHIVAGTTVVFNLYIRVSVIRTRPCDLDASSVEIRPYVDLDFDLTRKK